MSTNQSSYTSYSSTSYTTSSSAANGDPAQTKSYTEHATYNSADGGQLTRESRETGQPTLTETHDIPVQGGGTRLAGGANTSRRIEDVTGSESEQAERDREYLERVEDEYAKREGGA